MNFFGVFVLLSFPFNPVNTKTQNTSSENNDDTFSSYVLYHNRPSSIDKFTNADKQATLEDAVKQKGKVLEISMFRNMASNITTTQGRRQRRNAKMAYPTPSLLGNGQSTDFHYSGGLYNNPSSSSKGGIGDFSGTLESPLMYTRRQGYEDDAENYGPYEYPPDEPEDTTTEASYAEEVETEAPTPEETTTLAPFTLADVKVPAPFLRIEYMISFTFLGIMYGLGFFVLFQSLCVPAAKIAVYIVYLTLLKLGAVDPVTLEQALEQLPPT